MSEELRPCPFCGEMPVTENNLVACANKSCPTYDNYWTDPQILTIEQWNTRPLEDALNKRIAELEESDKHWAGNVKVCMQLIERYESNIAELEGIIKSDDERLTEAGLKVNLYFGCDTAEIMAEEILSSRARIAELEGELDKEKQVSNQLYLLLVDNPKDKELADSLTEAIRGTEEREENV